MVAQALSLARQSLAHQQQELQQHEGGKHQEHNGHSNNANRYKLDPQILALVWQVAMPQMIIPRS